MSTARVEGLQAKAVEQRTRIHQTADELRTKVAHTREKFDPTRNAREHLGIACLGVGAFGLLAGYAFGGLFTDR